MNSTVLHIDTGAPWRGGQQQVYLLHGELLARGLASRVLARRGGELERRCRQKDLPVAPVRGKGPWNPWVLVALRRSLRGVRVIHTHDSHGAALGALAKRMRPGLVLVCHRRVSYPLRRNPASRWKYSQVDAWVAVSEEIGEILARSGVPGRKIRVVHSAIDLESFRSEAAASDADLLRRSLNMAPQTPVVGFCGAFSPQKGHRVLLDAVPSIVARRPETVFLLPGEGELRTEVAASARAMGLEEAFRLPGPRSDVGALTGLFTVGVVPSVDGEGSSASIKEPMALGVPVVVSDLPGNLEVVGEGGLPFPNGDSGALAEAVLRLLDDEELRTELGRRARTRAERYRVPSMADGVLDVYATLLEGTP